MAIIVKNVKITPSVDKTVVDRSYEVSIDEFGKALVDRGIYKQEEVDKYIEVHYAKN